MLSPEIFVKDTVGFFIQNFEPSFATYSATSLFTKILTATFFKSSCIDIFVTFPKAKPLYSKVVTFSFKPSALLKYTTIFVPFLEYVS